MLFWLVHIDLYTKLGNLQSLVSDTEANHEPHPGSIQIISFTGTSQFNVEFFKPNILTTSTPVTTM